MCRPTWTSLTAAKPSVCSASATVFPCGSRMPRRGTMCTAMRYRLIRWGLSVGRTMGRGMGLRLELAERSDSNQEDGCLHGVRDDACDDGATVKLRPNVDPRETTRRPWPRDQWTWYARTMRAARLRTRFRSALPPRRSH